MKSHRKDFLMVFCLINLASCDSELAYIPVTGEGVYALGHGVLASISPEAMTMQLVDVKGYVSESKCDRIQLILVVTTAY